MLVMRGRVGVRGRVGDEDVCVLLMSVLCC